jgi:class 3 adenylate cyclase/tetratricopeptide (TPR) repeat protein
VQCQQCKTDNPIAGRFCVWCGTILQIACDACGHVAPSLTHFCASCGAPLNRSQGQRVEGGERKQATILFADIVGSTHFIAGLDAEAAMNQLRPALAAMAQAVRRFDGFIVRNLGDGLKAAFGAPQALEGHALLACRAALAMVVSVAALEAAPRIRVGLHSGEVVAGELDVGSSVDQEVAGMTVHLASRIEQLAEPGTVLMSEQCYQLVRAYCDTAPLGPQMLKGYAQPVPVHRLLGLKPAVASEQFRASALTTLQGRESEFAILQHALEQAEKGAASVIAISAPPGMGKSRLCYEFGEWCRRRHVEVLEARALIFGHATPLQPVLEMLRSLFRIPPLVNARDARRKIQQSSLALDIALDNAESRLLSDFLGFPSTDEPPAALDPTTQHARLRAIVGKLVRAAGSQLGVILVEDLHWLDEASGDFIETLVDAIEGTHIVLILNFRPPYKARWMDRPHYRELPLEELSPAHIAGIVRELVGDEPQLEEICTRVVGRSGGNPFFAEELVRSLADSNVIVGNRGHFRIGRSKLDHSLSPTLEAVIGARIDRLAEREKLLLQIGAIIGREFPTVIVEKVSAAAEGETKSLLARLCDAGLIQEQTTANGPGFAFRHPLIQEVALAMQLRSRRWRLHALIAHAIEAIEWGRLDEFAGLLAHHYEAAGQAVKAAMHLQRAARWVGRTNSAQAIKTWKKLRALLSDQPDSETTDRLRALASGQILSAGWREGMLAEEAKPYADEALRYARQIGDTLYEPMLLGSYGRIVGASGAADDYVAVAREALALASEAGDAGRATALGGMLSQAYFLAGKLTAALAASDAAIATATEQRGLDANVMLGLSVGQLLGFDVEHWIKCTRTRVLAGLGRFDEAVDAAERLLEMAPDRADPAVTQFIPHVALVEVARWRDDPAAAERSAKRVSAYAEQAEIPYLRVAALYCLGLAKAAAGDFAGAADTLRHAVDFARQVKAGLEFESRLLSELADTQYRAGDAALGAATAWEAILTAQRRTHRFAECQASITRAAAMLKQDDGEHEEPLRLLDRAAALIVETGAAALLARVGEVKAAIATDPA